ncbi:hypothetical protein IQ07DRAFT_594098 [Pyrenochaeta sp. DS3sAY3a]|nr:hypothetical protein IQ07DRAFT_594098 [Pyrenochaeta sp. DS3sAY3a]
MHSCVHVGGAARRMNKRNVHAGPWRSSRPDGGMIDTKPTRCSRAGDLPCERQDAADDYLSSPLPHARRAYSKPGCDAVAAPTPNNDVVVRPLSCILREQARVVHLPRLAKQAGHAEGYAAAGRWEHAETSVGSVLALRSICMDYVTLDSA